eukprot:CAMPEP_0183351968 /NCGR_PEP_ID=MMETSP0164_2-20130417/26600_1 /TAXON_ID=221442 /ORGANISM="Coccolithus pelagicus ssp braarudi, Strain PLY182g" /LENGTH=43 /DNA_ID= /DNA_START= /DNA_END= /DNA_ORIENTATION=
MALVVWLLAGGAAPVVGLGCCRQPGAVLFLLVCKMAFGAARRV